MKKTFRNHIIFFQNMTSPNSEQKIIKRTCMISILVRQTVVRGKDSRTLYCPMQNAGRMTIGKTHPRLIKKFLLTTFKSEQKIKLFFDFDFFEKYFTL